MNPLEELLEIAKSAKENFHKELPLKVVDEWKDFWMNQKQNNEEDYQNYWRRAFGIDANMRHHLANKIEKNFNIPQLADAVIDLITQLKDAQGEIEKLSTAIAEQFERLQVLRLTNESLDNDIEQLEVRNKWLEDRFDHVFIGEIEQRLTECEEVVNEYANMNGYYDRPDEARQYLAKWGVK